MTDDKSESFRVVDKRRFNDQTEAPAEPKKTPAPEKGPVATEDSITYSSFVFSLGMQGLVMMGEGGLQGVAEAGVEVNLPAARETIDLLALLKEKTKGNLTPEEEKLTEEILTSLRMTFVKKTK